ncbi:hypothetical protein, partial [Comamonas avium]|uniref:hypothetical protein n=1 Tax=Comamonas avium TaxID=2762231 RepID=UPI001CD89E26
RLQTPTLIGCIFLKKHPKNLFLELNLAAISEALYCSTVFTAPAKEFLKLLLLHRNVVVSSEDRNSNLTFDARQGIP